MSTLGLADVENRSLETLRLHNQSLLEELRSGQHHLRRGLTAERSASEKIVMARHRSAISAREKLAGFRTNVHTDYSVSDSKLRSTTATEVTRASSPLGMPSKENTRTSTPKTTPTKSKSRGITGTSRSILKHRQIIEDHIKVPSRFEHTPNAKSSTGLNFSYSNYDDLKMASERMRSAALDGSYLEEHPKMCKVQDASPALEDLHQQRLLLATGNDRSNKDIVQSLEQRPKSTVFEKAELQTETMKMKGDSRPLLGYDWIAGLLDNTDHSLLHQPDDYFEEIQAFRAANKADCVNTAGFSSVLDIGRPISPQVSNPAHTCVHGYSVNDRLFVEPLSRNEDGRSVCPVCLISRQEPTQQSPGFVRVSIPRSTLQSGYKIKPHRRRSFDPVDSCALAQHCLAGWECSKPAMLPTAGNLDLKHAAHGLRAQLETSGPEAQAVAAAYSRSVQLSSAPRSKTTQDLLNASRALNFSMQMLQKGKA